MHSPRASIAALLAASVAGLAFGLPASANAAPAAGAVKMKTTVKLTNVNGNDIDHVHFTGKVKAKRAVCEKRRTVKLKQVDQKLNAGKAKTNKKGVWKITFNGNRIDPGKFKMSVTKKVVKKGGKRIVCKATSTTVDV